MPEYAGSNQAENGQEEGQDGIPLAAGVVQRGLQEGIAAVFIHLLFGLLRSGGIGIQNGDGLDLLALGADGLILLDLLFVAVDKVVIADIHQLRLVLAVVVDGRIVGKENLILFQNGVGNGDGGNQAAGIGMEGEIKQLLRLRDLHDVALVDDADPVRDEADRTMDRSWAMNR